MRYDCGGEYHPPPEGGMEGHSIPQEKEFEKIPKKKKNQKERAGKRRADTDVFLGNDKGIREQGEAEGRGKSPKYCLKLQTQGGGYRKNCVVGGQKSKVAWQERVNLARSSRKAVLGGLGTTKRKTLLKKEEPKATEKRGGFHYLSG